jgi:hypothetical protein
VVRRALLLALCLQGCTTREGVVLIARDAHPGASPDAAIGAADTRGVCRTGGAEDGFYEAFDGDALDGETWLVADGTVTFAARRGSFAPENVALDSGALVLRVRGDLYSGPVRARDAEGRPLPNVTRSGAAVATRDLFASATYQIQGHLTAPDGVEVAIWFMRDHDDEGGLDITTPGLDGTTRSYRYVHMRSRDGRFSNERQFELAQALDDATPILRFDWYTTKDNDAVFWVDDEPRWNTSDALPSKRAGRMWIVAWLPDDAPAAFETAEIRIDNAFVTPFGNDGDLCTDGELSGTALIPP